MTHHYDHERRRDENRFHESQDGDFTPTRPLGSPRGSGQDTGKTRSRGTRRTLGDAQSTRKGQFFGNPLSGGAQPRPAQPPRSFRRDADDDQDDQYVSESHRDETTPDVWAWNDERAPRFDAPDAQDVVSARLSAQRPAPRTSSPSWRIGRARITRTRAALGAAASLLIVFSAVAAVLMHSGYFTAHAAVGAPSGVTVTWGDSTGLVRWPAVSGASSYQVTLFRTSDTGIMQQFKVPATQLAADVQGVWYGEKYQVAVQAVDASGQIGSPSLSAVGASNPISRSAYNGFLDQENRSAGAIDPNLWDMHIYDGFETNYGVSFVNGQLHYHLETGDPNGHQTLATMRARVPIDWSGRTATIHGEVDLKGTFHNWFAAVLSPQATGPDRIMDLVDRGYSPRTMPQLELFDDQDGLHLLYAEGNHTAPRDLGHVPNPINLSNVRDDIIWKVSDTQVQVILDGQSALNVTLPAPLTFSTGYLTLAAEDYPGSTGGVHPPVACDAVMAACNVWHLDNWGFDAASGQQPLTTAYYANGCAPYPTVPQGADFAPAGSAECGSRTVDVASTSNLTSAAISFEAKRPGNISVSVNGGPWHAVNDIASDVNIYNAQDYIVPISPSELQTGANTVSYQLGGGMSAFNTEIETVSSTPYTAPAEPAQPTPLGTWGGSTAPAKSTATSTATSTQAATATTSVTATSTTTSTATATATSTTTATATATSTATAVTSPIALNSAPCMLTINGQQVSGTCTGTIAPSGSNGATPTSTSTSTPTNMPTPVPTATQPPTPTNGGRQAGINVEPSMRPFRYNGANPDSWWCVQPNCFQDPNPMTTINNELSLAQQLGVSVVRIEFPWALIEPGNGVYDWSRADAIVNAANAHGVQLQPIIVYTPPWINSDPTQAPTASEFSSFVTALVGRYHNSIHYWEMWNEPNITNYYAAGEQSYVSNILVPGNAAVKAVDPSAKVILGAPAWADFGWLNGIYNMGGGNSFDIMAWHDYGSPQLVLVDAGAVQNVLIQHGQSNKPLWLGEYGVQEATTNDTQQQALLTQVLTAANSPIAMAEWYNLRDDYSMTCCPQSPLKMASWGFVQHDDATLKQGFALLKQLIANGLPKPS